MCFGQKHYPIELAYTVLPPISMYTHTVLFCKLHPYYTYTRHLHANSISGYCWTIAAVLCFKVLQTLIKLIQNSSTIP